MGVFNHDASPPPDFLDMFLLTIYQGLLSADEVKRKKVLIYKNSLLFLGYYLCNYKFV